MLLVALSKESKYNIRICEPSRYLTYSLTKGSIQLICLLAFSPYPFTRHYVTDCLVCFLQVEMILLRHAIDICDI